MQVPVSGREKHFPLLIVSVIVAIGVVVAIFALTPNRYEEQSDGPPTDSVAAPATSQTPKPAPAP